MDNLDIDKNDEVLEIGTGSGFIAIQIAEKVRRIIATDISEKALNSAIYNSKINNVEQLIEFRLGFLFDPIKKDEKFSLIIFNSPYLPTMTKEKVEKPLNFAWDGGKDGRGTIDKFIHNINNYLKQNGKILLVQSSLTGISETINKFNKIGFKTKIIAEKKYFFETIILIESHKGE